MGGLKLMSLTTNSKVLVLQVHLSQYIHSHLEAAVPEGGLPTVLTVQGVALAESLLTTSSSRAYTPVCFPSEPPRFPY